MLSITKIVHFEMAHAIHGYLGACKNIHGHSYELQVTITDGKAINEYIPAPGFIIDFKELKNCLTNNILQTFDHTILLSTAYLADHPALRSMENLLEWEMEPTAENLLIFIKKTLFKNLPNGTRLIKLKLLETKDSFAEWSNELYSL